jgi:hypothetical protein
MYNKYCAYNGVPTNFIILTVFKAFIPSTLNLLCAYLEEQVYFGQNKQPILNEQNRDCHHINGLYVGVPLLQKR